MSNILNKFKLGDTIIDIEDASAQRKLNNLATVATTGSYNDLTNKPTIPPAITIDSALSTTSTNPVQNKIITTKVNSFANVATSGNYNDLTNKPSVAYNSETKTISFTNF